MHLTSIPRHQIETTLHDYIDIARSLIVPSRRDDPIRAFERSFCEYVGCRHAIAVSSGRLAIHLILEALEPEPQSEALIPAFNLFAVIERFCQFGITPLFCDVRRDDLNVDLDDAERKITARTRFLLATHMFGHSADMSKARELADRNRLILLEDCAHALGTEFGGKKVGTFGRASIFSFSVLKLVTTFGGGMITTNDDQLAQRIRGRLQSAPSHAGFSIGLRKAITGSIMDLGTRAPIFSFGAWPALRLLRAFRPDFQQQMMTETPRRDRSFNAANIGPLHAFQGRLGLNQLAHVDRWIARRREVGRWLDHELRDTPQIRLIQSQNSSLHNGLYYGILAERANNLAEYLFRQGIDCETSEYRNCADLDLYREFAVNCPVSREVESRILRLPNHPSLNRRCVQRIGRAIRAFYTTQSN